MKRRHRRVKPGRLLQEAAAGVTQRVSRSALTVVGTALGIGSFIAVLGVTSSANGQISQGFNERTSTQVAVELAGAGADAGFPVSAEVSVAGIEGVESVGTWWDVSILAVSSLPPHLDDNESDGYRVLAASPGYWDVVQPTLAVGRTFDASLAAAPVAVVGEQLARSLNVTDVQNFPTLFIDGQALTVIGIVSNASQGTAPLAAITIPADFARTAFGLPGASEHLTIDTAVGAGQVVADQVAIAVDAIHPERFRVTAPPNPTVVRDQVSGSLQTLFFALALICLLVGAVGITNASLIGVMSRVPEIGIRRSLGALPRHIAAQFLIESAILGLLGGAIGASLGLIAVAGVALSQQWTAVVQPWTIFGAPLVGAVVGLVAGLYPALRASRIEPVEAFRR